MRTRHLLGACVVALTAVLATGLPAHAADGDEQALAERFAPVVRLVQQDVECGPGEPYQPSAVELVLGDKSVALRGPWDDEARRRRPDGRGPGRRPLRLPPGLPGQPARGGLRLRGVGASRGSGRRADDVQPRDDRGRSGRPARPAVLVLLPLQRLHQQARGRLGDGPARLRRRRRGAGPRPDTRSRSATPSTRASRSPSGTTRSSRSSTAPTRSCTAAAGSHANYYDDALYLGTSAEQGFGCDDTRGPADDLSPTIAVIPSDPAAAKAEFPWIGFQGRWGQREEAFYNGPTGPNTKDELDPPDQLPGAERPRPQLRRACRRPVRHLGHRLLLQHRLERVRGRPQARRQPRAPARSSWRCSPCSWSGCCAAPPGHRSLPCASPDAGPPGS